MQKVIDIPGGPAIALGPRWMPRDVRWRPAPHPDLFRLLRPAPLVLLLAWALQATLATPPLDAGAEPDLGEGLVATLEARGLGVDPGGVKWLDGPNGLVTSVCSPRRAIFLAQKEGEPADVYLASARTSPEGRLLRLAGLYNLTDTSAVAETNLIVGTDRAAWTIGDGKRISSIHYADLRGEPPPTGPGWTWAKGLQQQLTNFQETGQLSGVRRRSFKLDPAGLDVLTAFTAQDLLIHADGRAIRIPTETNDPISGARFLQEQEHHLAMPGNFVTWAVDRVRALPWFGSDRMQAVKAVAFAGLDLVQRFVGSVTGDDGSEQVKEELGELLDVPAAEYTDPTTGWPPAPMETLFTPTLKGEGKWHPMDNDPFVRTNEGAPSPFVTSFIRVDSERRYSQIFVTMWDPRQVRLSMVSGTVEPKSATGETGPGLVPRDPEVMGRLLAGFNGGFQATHGEYGMMADGVVYLPPKPYAATLSLMKDGSNAFGTWPTDERVPEEMVSYRQNMSPLWQDGVRNPYKRHWWGGVPPGWEDESRTVRSAICLTVEGFMAYLYGTSADANQLADAMQRARCTAYGIHLDMNAGHTGLEFYLAGPRSQVPSLGGALDRRWQAEGLISEMPGWRFRGRRMIRFMGLMNFPRYINRESRDFFYLTLRHILPGKNPETAVPQPAAGEGVWQLAGLPQHGWPHAVATSFTHPDPGRPATEVRVLKLDPRMLRLSASDNDNRQLVIAFSDRSAQDDGTAALWFGEQRFTVQASAPTRSARRLVNGFLSGDERANDAMAVFGIDPGGMLLYAEVSTGLRIGEDRKLLEDFLKRLGCGSFLWLPRPAGAAIGGAVDLSGQPVALSRKSTLLVRAPAPGARRIFHDTPVVEPEVWFALQSRRVRYFRKGDPRALQEGGAE